MDAPFCVVIAEEDLNEMLPNPDNLTPEELHLSRMIPVMPRPLDEQP